MGDPFQPTLPGRPLEIPAEAWNAFLIGSRADKERKHNQLAEPLDQIRQGDILKVRNGTGEDRLRFHVLGLETPIISPGQNLREFKNQATFHGVKPRHPKHFGRFTILLDPLRGVPPKIGRGWISGVCPAFVDIQDRCHQFADVKDNDPTMLQSRPAGSARILWREKEEGKQWTIVRLSNVADDFHRFRLTEPLWRCGRAEAWRVVYDENPSGFPEPCQFECPFTVVDSLGVAPPEGSPPGTFGWAKWLPDSQQWEVVQLASGCCESSSSSSESGSSSSGPPDDGVSIQEADVRCQNGKLIVYVRDVQLSIRFGALRKSTGPWRRSHTAGCCCCEGCASSSSSSSSEPSESSGSSNTDPDSSSSEPSSSDSSSSSSSSSSESSSVSSGSSSGSEGEPSSSSEEEASSSEESSSSAEPPQGSG